MKTFQDGVNYAKKRIEIGGDPFKEVADMFDSYVRNKKDSENYSDFAKGIEEVIEEEASRLLNF